ncbi:MFS transporter [Rhizobium rhizogenes]|uniref:Transporter protein n=1 Tax=Rhizobium rhizogenes (strain K84 / ATCC BAA-868) TaxID=311403 RepID=B9JE84_RHIR8|nr:transporter protein [Rhizobium rhizogenes K84]OCJ20326.1 transporter [Agrobacterium sp. B131/95]
MDRTKQTEPSLILEHRHQRSARRFYLLSTSFAAVGRNAYYVGAVWVLAVSGELAGSIALFLALGSIAEFLVGAPAGRLADRFDRRYLCMMSDAARIFILLLTSAALLVPGKPAYVLYSSVILYAVADRIYLLASSAIIPSIARPGRLVSFNSLAYIGMQVGNMLAAIAAGWLLDLAPQQLCFLLAAGTFAVSCLGMSRIAVRTSGPTADHLLRYHQTDASERLGRLPLTLIVNYILIYAMGMLISALASIFVLQELGGSSTDFGRLEACWAVGAVVSMSILMLKAFNDADGRAIPIIVMLSGVGMASFHFMRNLEGVVALMAALGAGYNLTRVLIDVEIQRRIPSAKLGLVKGRIHVACMGFSLALYAVLAMIGNGITPSVTFLVFGSGMIVCVAFGHVIKLVTGKFSFHRRPPS